MENLKNEIVIVNGLSCEEVEKEEINIAEKFECEYESLLESLKEQEIEEFESIISDLENELDQLEEEEEDEDEDEEDEDEEEDYYCDDYYSGIKRRAMKIAEENWFSEKGKKAKELVTTINNYEEICNLSLGDLPDHSNYNLSGLYNGYVKSALEVWERAFETQKKLLEELTIKRAERAERAVDFEEEDIENPLLLEEESYYYDEDEDDEEDEEDEEMFNLYTLYNVAEAIEQLTLESFIINDRPNNLWKEEEYADFYIIRTLFNYFKKNKEIDDNVFEFEESLYPAEFGNIKLSMPLSFNFKVLKTMKNKEIIKNIENEDFDKSDLLELDIEYVV